MTPDGRAGPGGLVLVASRVAVFMVTAGSGLVLARTLGPERYGVLASATAIAGILLLLGIYGLEQLYLVDSIDLAEFTVRSTQVFGISAATVAVGALAWPAVGSSTRLCVLLVGMASAADQLKLPYLLEPQRRLDFACRARRETALRIAAAATSVVVVLVWRSPVAVAASLLAASVVLLLPTRTTPGLHARYGWRSLRKVLRRGLPFAASGALYTVYFQVDMALLASLRGPDEVAQYRAAFSLVAAAVVLAVAWNNEIMRPRLYRERDGGPQFAAILRSSAAVSVTGGALCALGMVMLGPAAIRIAYGRAYEPAGALVQILGLAMVFHFFNSWAGNVLVAKRRVRLVVALQGTLVAANVVGNLLLIPSRGARGAAGMTVVTELTGCVLYGLALWSARRPSAGDDDQPLAEQDP